MLPSFNFNDDVILLHLRLGFAHKFHRFETAEAVENDGSHLGDNRRVRDVVWIGHGRRGEEAVQRCFRSCSRTLCGSPANRLKVYPLQKHHHRSLRLLVRAHNCPTRFIKINTPSDYIFFMFLPSVTFISFLVSEPAPN